MDRSATTARATLTIAQMNPLSADLWAAAASADCNGVTHRYLYRVWLQSLGSEWPETKQSGAAVGWPKQGQGVPWIRRKHKPPVKPMPPREALWTNNLMR